MSASHAHAAAWIAYDLIEGERVEGIVAHQPQPGAPNGNRLFLRRDYDTIAIPATGKRGHVVLERQLRELGVKPGDTIAVTYLGKRTTVDGEREYRLYRTEVLS